MKNKKSCFVAVLVFIIVIVVMGLLGIFIMAVGRLALSTSGDYKENYVEGLGDNKVVLLQIKGAISNQGDEGNLFEATGASAPEIIRQIDLAVSDPKVVGILVEMDSPGGEIVASDLIYQKLLEAKQEGITVVTYMQTLGASGGYYIAAASDAILANELTTTGSIGVYSVFQDVSGLYEKLGIEQRVIKQGDFKTGAGLFDGDDNGVEDRIYQEIVDQAQEKFVSVVAEGRGLSIAEVEGLADGRVYTGKQAVENGLIDQIGGRKESIAEMKLLTGVSDLYIVEYASLDFWGELLSIFNGFNVNALLYNLAKQEQGMKMMYMMR